MTACLFIKASREGALEVKDVLLKYCNASGQRINMDKSSIFFSKGCPEGLREEIKSELDVQKETLNEKYLGMPSDVARSKSGALKYLKDKVWKKVLGWLEQLLSVGGKEILIKSGVGLRRRKPGRIGLMVVRHRQTRLMRVGCGQSYGNARYLKKFACFCGD